MSLKKPNFSAIKIAVIGNILEQYDFSLYAYFSPLFATLFFPNTDFSAGLLAVFGVYAAGMLMRPLGALLIGYLGDTLGRKQALLISLMMIALPTICIGLLPTYASIGIWAPILLTIFRLIQGLSVGGEYTSSIIYLTENVEQKRRGFAGSFALVGTGTGWLLASLTSMFIMSFLSTEAITSYGWRIPFLLGFLTALYGFIVRAKATETPEFVQLKARKALSAHPLKEALKEQKKKMGIVFGFNLISTVAGYLIYAYFPTFLHKVTGMAMSQALLINTLGLSLFIFLIPLAGYISDLVGSRKLFLIGASAFVLFSYPLFVLLSQGTFAASLSAVIIFTFMISFYHGPLPGFMAEFFPPQVRASSVAISYNFASSLFSGTCPMVASLLIQTTGNSLSPSFYLMLAGLISFIVVITNLGARSKEQGARSFSFQKNPSH